MPSLMYLVVCSVTLLSVLPSVFSTDTIDMTCWGEWSKIDSCLKDKWSVKMSLSPDADQNQRECCFKMDLACTAYQWIEDSCTYSKNMQDVLFKEGRDHCKKSGTEWSVEMCAKLNPKPVGGDFLCKNVAKWLTCPDLKTVEDKAAKGKGMTLVTNWIYCLLAPIALIVLKYFN